MEIQLERAQESDAAAIAALRLAVARDLTARFGRGTWTYAADSEAGVRMDLQTARVFIVRGNGGVIATLRLAEKKPWMLEVDFFTPARRPVYLTTMAIAPGQQRRGLGRACLEAADGIARAWSADAIRLDSYDAPAGAGEFYRKCGFQEVRRLEYHGTRLIFFERCIGAARNAALRRGEVPLRRGLGPDAGTA